MKRIILVLMLTAFVSLLSSCSDKKTEYVTVPPAPLKDQTTTVMVYIEGSNLESEEGAASENIVQMMNARHSKYLNVVILTGAADVIHPDVDADINKPRPIKDWTRVQRHQVLEGEVKLLGDQGPGCSEEMGITKDCVEMGSANILSDFVQTAANEFPADRYILVLWDHGGGSISGYGGAPAKPIGVKEIKEALDRANVPLEIIGFDACLMANAEFAHNLSGNAKYLVASEELEPGDGWDYNTFLSAIAKNPKLTGAEIGKTIADGFFTSNKQEESLTLSVTDLSKVNNIVTAIDSLSAKVLEAFNADNHTTWMEFFNARNATDEFGAMAVEGFFINDVDISDFAASLDYHSNGKYKAQTDMLQNTVENAITYNIVSGMHNNSIGLSFWMPFHFGGELSVGSRTQNYLGLYDVLYGGELIKFSNTYIKLLKELVKYADETPSEFEISDEIVVDGEKVEAKITSNFGIDDILLMRDISTDPAFIQPVLATIADYKQDGADGFLATADYDLNIFTLNGMPIYVQSNGRLDRSKPTSYLLNIPLYYQESADAEPERVTVLVAYDFATEIAQVGSALTPLDSTGRDEIEMQVGNVLIIPTVTIDAEGNIITEPSDFEIVLEADLAQGLELSRAVYSMGGTESFAFAATNLKGDSATSAYFGADAPTTTAMRAGSMDKSKALADALKKPFWSSKK